MPELNVSTFPNLTLLGKQLTNSLLILSKLLSKHTDAALKLFFLP